MILSDPESSRVSVPSLMSDVAEQTAATSLLSAIGATTVFQPALVCDQGPAGGEIDNP
jgi:ABC-type amino acid transport system permease subunit